MFSMAPVDSSDTREMEVKSLRTESIIYTPIQMINLSLKTHPNILKHN